jgi:hypothetical protein
MNAIMAWYREQQRAVRWSIWAAVGLVAYFGILEPVVDASLRASREADLREAALNRLAESAADWEAEALAVRKFGRMELPADTNTRTLRLNRAVTAVLEAHGVRRHTSSTKMTSMEQGPLQAAVPATDQVWRFVREIQFEASPEVVASILADLERSPDISCISRVQLRRGGEANRGDRVVRATVAVEAWIQMPRGQGRAR